ncbi:cyclin-A1 [Paramormyrops kingsleyae]|uniref:cyclin-A1 n=1 Tax=Paramormyrops kingsleyae TaxID=1676925 RepID=UPI003B9787E5
MNRGRFITAASRYGQENITTQRGEPNRINAPRLPFTSKTRERTVLGVLNDNELHSRSSGQGDPQLKRRPAFDNAFPSVPTTTLPTCLSNSSFDIYVDEPSDILPVTSTFGVAQSQLIDEDHAALQHKDFCLFLDLSSGSCLDASMRSQPEDDLTSQDFFAVTEYSEDIHAYLRQSEVKHRPKTGYMKKQPDITNSMRVILVDWLADVGEEYKLCTETLHLTVNYLDRFLSCMSVHREKLQLVGAAAILVAAKYEEIYPPDVDELVYVTDDTYSKKQLLRMEQLLLNVLAFDLTVPTAHQFLRQFFTVASVCSKTENLALYLAELSLLEVDPFLQYIPSKVAAAAYSLGNYTINKTLWPDTLHAFTGYTLVEILPCLKELHKLYLDAGSRPQQAVQEKYKSSKYCSVALVPPPKSLPLH